MKIGVLGCFYGCDDLLPQVLAPWLTLKAEGHDIQIAAVHGQFKEYAELGYPRDDEKTVAILKQHEGEFLALDLLTEPLSEHEVRAVALARLLQTGVDLVWLVDGDEIYSAEEIARIIGFVEATPEFDHYHVHFDNRIFGGKRWADDFFPPRIIRTDRRGGIRGFAWDNDLTWNDGTTLNDGVPGIIPKSIAHVAHHTWRLRDAEAKIAYQRKHFGYSMFRIGASGPEPDPAYFAQHAMPLPESLDDGFTLSDNPRLDVIMRTHLGGNVHGGTRVSDALGGKEELIVRALRSLVNSLLRLYRRNDTRIRLTLIDDHSAPHLRARLHELLSRAPFETQVFALEERGNAASLRACYEWARTHAEDLVYFVEDDHLHEETALEEMCDAYRAFSARTRAAVALFPVDYVHLYESDRMEVTRLVAGSRRHWRLVQESTGTFLVDKATLDAHWDKFVLFTENGVIESTSINAIWRDHALLFSPIPTLAIHLHDESLMPPFSNWRKLWNSAAGGSRTMGKVSTIVEACSLDAHFLPTLISEAQRFSDDIIVVAHDHLFSGVRENLAYLDTIATQKHVRIIVLPWSEREKPRHYHNAARWEGIRDARHDWVLLLDGDEVPDGARMKSFLATKSGTRNGYALASWWYYREPTLRATEHTIAGLLARKADLSREIMFSEEERLGYRGKLDVEELATLDGEPLIHHFSWARSKETLLKKVGTWAHRDEGDIDWVALVEKEFSRPFTGTDPIFGFRYETVDNRFNIRFD